jgi:GAF domain-containing protein
MTFSERVLRGRNLALQELARGSPLERVLGTLARSAESCFPGVRCSVLLLDAERRLRHGDSPSLPDFYVRAVDGLEIGPDVGSCGRRPRGRSASSSRTCSPTRTGRRSARSPSAADVRACWSEPFFSSSGDVLGTFAMYYGEPRKPLETELDFINATAHLAASRSSAERVRGTARSCRRSASASGPNRSARSST